MNENERCLKLNFFSKNVVKAFLHPFYCLLYIAMLQTELASTRPCESRNETTNITSPDPPELKKQRFSLFDHYSQNTSELSESTRQEKQLQLYIDTINSSSFNSTEITLQELLSKSDFSLLCPLFEHVLCSPASSAPVERVFSQSGLLMRPHRSRMTDSVLESLVFLKCNL